MRKVIGYMDGTDSLWLTTLQLLGYDTFPISNGYDGHGMNIMLLSEQRKPDLIVGYLHKVVPTATAGFTPAEVLYRTKVYEIPVLIVCPGGLQGRCHEVCGEDLPDNVTLVDPADVVPKIQETLG